MSKLNILAPNYKTYDPQIQPIIDKISIESFSEDEQVDEILRRKMIQSDKNNALTRDIYLNTIQKNKSFPARTLDTGDPLGKMSVEQKKEFLKNNEIWKQKNYLKMKNLHDYYTINADSKNIEIIPEENPFPLPEEKFKKVETNLEPIKYKINSNPKKDRAFPIKTNRALLFQ